MLNNNSSWKNLFLGRKKELQFLADSWSSVANRQKTCKPQMRAIISESGYGKTKLAQEFFRELSTSQDPENYWPSSLASEENKLEIMPSCAAQNNDNKSIPWFWFGLRWDDDPQRRNNPQIGSPFNQVYGAPEFLIHQDPILEKIKRKNTEKKALTKTSKIATKATLNLITGGLFEVVSETVNLLDDINDSFNSLAKVRKTRIENSETDSTDQRLRERNVLKIIRTFSVLLDEKEGLKGSLPVLLLIDNAHSIDPFSLDVLKHLWEMAVKRDWPLMILATHWKREWELTSTKKNPSFSTWFLEEREKAPDSVKSTELSKLHELELVLKTALPGLSASDSHRILQRTNGNPLHLSELLLFLEQNLHLFVEEDSQKSLTEKGQRFLENKSTSIEDLERSRFDGIGEPLKDLLGLASLQGSHFIKSIVTSLASKINSFPDQNESGELLNSSISPFALTERVSTLGIEFRSQNLQKSANKHLFLSKGEDFLWQFSESIIQNNWLIIKNTDWNTLSPKEKEILLEYLFNGSSNLQNKELVLHTVARGIHDSFHAHDWCSFLKWKNRWLEINEYLSFYTNQSKISPLADGELLFFLGINCHLMKEYDIALKVLELAENKHIEEKKPIGKGKAIHEQGLVCYYKNDFPQAIKRFKAALNQKEKFETKYEQGKTWFMLGNVYTETNDEENAIKAYGKALEFCDKELHGAIYHQLAYLMETLSMWRSALTTYRDALKHHTAQNQFFLLGTTWYNIGLIYEKQNDQIRAISSYNIALEHDYRSNSLLHASRTLASIGALHLKQKEWNKALDVYNRSIEIETEYSPKSKLRPSWLQVGKILYELEDYKNAATALEKSLDHAPDKSNKSTYMAYTNTLSLIGLTYKHAGEYEKAYSTLELAVERILESNFTDNIGIAYEELFSTSMSLGNWEKSKSYLELALSFYSERKNKKKIGYCYRYLSKLYAHEKAKGFCSNPIELSAEYSLKAYKFLLLSDNRKLGRWLVDTYSTAKTYPDKNGYKGKVSNIIDQILILNPKLKAELEKGIYSGGTVAWVNPE